MPNEHGCIGFRAVTQFRVSNFIQTAAAIGHEDPPRRRVSSPWKFSPASRKTSEYQLIDLATGAPDLDHGDLLGQNRRVSGISYAASLAAALHELRPEILDQLPHRFGNGFDAFELEYFLMDAFDFVR